MTFQGNARTNMHRLKVYKAIFCFILLFDLVIGKRCDPDTLISASEQCHQSQLCDETSKSCQCRPGFEHHNDTFCVDARPRTSRAPTPNTSSLVAGGRNSGSIVAGILIPLFLILFVIYGVYVSRKYKLVGWVRRKIHQRNNSYDEFMIGQEPDPEDDDPPLR